MANLQHFTAAIVASLVGGGVAYGVATAYKPAPTLVQPKTTVIARPGPVSEGNITRSERRLLDASWGDLDQKEIDAVAAALTVIAPVPMVIFCHDDSKCGDMALDFENAFESAHWKDVKQETPLIDDTVGVATSRADLRDAINQATSGRLAVKIIAKNAPYDVLVIGKKGRK